MNEHLIWIARARIDGLRRVKTSTIALQDITLLKLLGLCLGNVLSAVKRVLLLRLLLLKVLLLLLHMLLMLLAQSLLGILLLCALLVHSLPVLRVDLVSTLLHLLSLLLLLLRWRLRALESKSLQTRMWMTLALEGCDRCDKTKGDNLDHLECDFAFLKTTESECKKLVYWMPISMHVETMNESNDI